MNSRHWFSILTLLLFTLSAHSQCVDELNALERAQQNLIDSINLKSPHRDSEIKKIKPTETRQRQESWVRELVQTPKNNPFGYTEDSAKFEIRKYREEITRVDQYLRNPQPTGGGQQCAGDRPGWESCVRAVGGETIAIGKLRICGYETWLTRIQGAPATNATQAQQSRQSTQTSQPSNTQPANTPEQKMTQQSAARARETQAKGDADAKRQGRRRHDPAMEAHECMKPNFGGLYGGMINSCPYKVNYTYCGFRPSENSWLKDIMDCEMQKFGLDAASANREDAAHTKGVESIHWFACKDPAMPMDSSFEGGQIQARCRILFAN